MMDVLSFQKCFIIGLVREITYCTTTLERKRPQTYILGPIRVSVVTYQYYLSVYSVCGASLHD
jgi:hypothetical protein